MHIGINGMRLSGQRLGVGRYIEYLLKYWDELRQPEDQFSILVQRPFDPAELGLSSAFRAVNIGPSLPGLLWENLLVPPYARHLDVLFCPSYTMPLLYGGACVVANHSVNEIQAGTHPWWYHLTYGQRYRLSARRAQSVVVPSPSAKDDIVSLYGLASDRIEVIPQGVADAFRPLDDRPLLAETRRRYLGQDVPFIVFVGKLSQRRNIPLLLAAFAQLKRHYQLPHKLLLFGPNHEHLPLEHHIQAHGIADCVVQTDGQVKSHDELIAIYNAADLYVNASSYEGFSLTLVEAMACGCPVVAVNRAAMRDVAAGSALLIDEPTVPALSTAMHRALTDQPLRQELRQRSLVRARHFRYQETARLTLELLRRVATGATNVRKQTKTNESSNSRRRAWFSLG